MFFGLPILMNNNIGKSPINNRNVERLNNRLSNLNKTKSDVLTTYKDDIEKIIELLRKSSNKPSELDIAHFLMGKI